jgi:Lrp/AsnC family leucine-responsive transcriptional regulator
MIDDIGYQILDILQRKARIPNVEVARQVNMAPSAVLERIRKLESLGYIDGYEVRLNPARFNRALVAFAFIETREAAERNSVAEALARIPDIQEIHFIAGPDRFLIKVRVTDTVALNRLLQEDIASIEGIERTCTHVVLDTRKETANFPIGDAS